MSPGEFVSPLAGATAVVAVGDETLRRGVTGALSKTAVRLLDDGYESGEIDELASLVQRFRPTILLLGLPGLKVDAAAALARIAGLEFAPRLIAVNDSANPELILKAMRAGASEFVYPPIEPGFEDALKAVVSSAPTRPDAGAAGKVIGFVSVKGGCGATTLACHAAAWLKSSAHKEVLLADLDTSAGIVDTLMQSAAKHTLDDALQNLHRLDLKLWKAVVSASPSGVDVMAAPAEPSSVMPISRRLPPMLRFWRMHYDFALVDLGHGMSSTLLDVLSSIDTLFLVTTTEIPALRRTSHMIESLAKREFGANRVKLVLNRMPKRSAIGTAELEKIMGLPIHSVVPDDAAAMQEAYSCPRLLDLNSHLGREFAGFAARLAGVTQPAKKSRGVFAFR